jgi:hypothetical protein
MLFIGIFLRIQNCDVNPPPVTRVVLCSGNVDENIGWDCVAGIATCYGLDGSGIGVL